MARRGSPAVSVRIDAPLWERFGALTDDRSATIRALLHWYVGDEGWPLPTRTAEPITDGEAGHSAT